MDMDIERFIEMLSHKAIKNSFRVPLIGGEPLLHKNFFDFVEIAAKHKKLVYTFTNGLLLEKNLDSFANASLDTLRISLYDDVLDEQKHNIRKLLSINPKFKVYLSTWTTPFKLDALERAVEIALELGVSGLNIQNYMPHTDGKDLNELAMLIWEDDTKTLEKIKDIKKEVAGRMSLTLPVPIPRKSHPKSCICLNTMLYLDRRGLIVPCPGIWPPKPEYGNLLGKDGWNSPFMVDFRENFDKKFPYNHVCKHCFWGHGMIQKNSDFLLD
jgi:MoaA/NifB/PqqE/SkfB family radical SAM enzyme